MPRTVIGPETRIAGALYGKDDLVIEGVVDGPVHGEAAVTLAPGSTVNGIVRGHDVTLAGKLAYDVFATGTVHLAATAELTGNVETPRIAIDEGAVFEGQVKMKRGAAATAPKPAAAAAPAAPPPAPVAAPAPAAKRAAPAPAGPREIPSLPSIGKAKLVRRTS
jgi:cytoskeletal protein CcmA (bactofilin family)